MRLKILWKNGQWVASVIFACVSFLETTLAQNSFIFPAPNPAGDKYSARTGSDYTNSVTYSNKVKLTVMDGEVLAVTSREIIVARRTITVRIEPQPMSGWKKFSEPWTATRNFREQPVSTAFAGVAFAEIHEGPDNDQPDRWEWIVPHLRVADLQVDSLNQRPYGGVTGTDDEDAREDTNSGGKILGSNSTPYSAASNKPGWADFSAAPASHPPFATMHLFLQSFPRNTQVRFQYSGSNPSAITQDNEGHWIPPAQGSLRVWTKNVYQPRSLTHYIPPETSYTFEQLNNLGAQVADGHFVFYVEAVKVGNSSSDTQVIVEVLTPGSSWTPLDTVRLAPLEVKVNSANPPEGTAGGKYSDPDRPKRGNADNLFSVWPGEDFTVKVKIPATFQLPQGLIKWSVEGEAISIPDNTKEFTFNWGTPGLRRIEIRVGESTFLVWVDLPDVGTLNQNEALLAVDSVSAVAILAHAVTASAYTNDDTNFPTFTPKRDAMKHSFWNALCISDNSIDPAAILTVGTAHEFNNKFGIPEFVFDQPGPGPAFATTMDLRNNAIGLTTAHSIVGVPDWNAILADLEIKYSLGQMWIYDGTTDEGSSEGILSKSNQLKIFPQ